MKAQHQSTHNDSGRLQDCVDSKKTISIQQDPSTILNNVGEIYQTKASIGMYSVIYVTNAG